MHARRLGRIAEKSFQARLAWRDHFMQKLEDEPALWNTVASIRLMRGCAGDDAANGAGRGNAGETGLPFV